MIRLLSIFSASVLLLGCSTPDERANAQVAADRRERIEQHRRLEEEARENFESMQGSTPLVEGLILLAKSYLCAANRELCNSREADQGFKEVEGFLVANGEAEAELLAACRPHRGARVTA